MTKELISKHSKSNNKTAATKLRRILKHFIDAFSSDKDNLKKSAFKEHVRFSFLFFDWGSLPRHNVKWTFWRERTPKGSIPSESVFSRYFSAVHTTVYTA